MNRAAYRTGTSRRRPLREALDKDLRNKVLESLDALYQEYGKKLTKDARGTYEVPHVSEIPREGSHGWYSYQEATDYTAFKSLIEDEKGKGVLVKDNVRIDVDSLDEYTAKRVIRMLDAITFEGCVDTDYARDWFYDDLWEACVRIVKEYGKDESYYEPFYFWASSFFDYIATWSLHFGVDELAFLLDDGELPEDVTVASSGFAYIEKHGKDFMKWNDKDMEWEIRNTDIDWHD